MSSYYEEPSVEGLRPEPFEAKDWLAPRTVRDIVHIGRGLLLHEVRLALRPLQPTLAAQGGFAFYRTYAHDSEYRILVNNQADFAGESATIISSNVLGSPGPEDDCPLDDQAMLLTDLVVTDSSKWTNFAWEAFSKGQMEHTWPNPQFATLLEPGTDSVRLVGNLRSPHNFEPYPALDRQEVSDVSDILWNTLGTLALCSPASLDEGVTEFRD